MSNYPAQIDNSISLPAAVDSATTVSASVVNKLRAAILATQTELGVKPSGTESTVRYRLDLIADSISSLLANSISLGTQDLGGTPLLPKVVGLQGRPLSSVAPTNGQVVGWDGLAWGPTTVSGGAGSAPGGSDEYVQFNDSSTFGGDAGLTYNKTTNVLSLSDAIAIGSNPAATGALRLTIGDAITSHNTANTADLELIKATGAGDTLSIWGLSGSYGHSYMNIGSGANLFIRTTGTDVLTLSDTLSSFGTNVAIGATPATTGDIRVPSTTSIISSRNAADSANFVALATDASDNLYVGAAADGTADYAQVIINPGSFGYLYLSGVPKLTWGANDMTISTINAIQDGNANGLVTDVIRSLHTADATVTNIYTWTIQVDAVTTVDALITAIADDGTVGASYKRTVTFRESAGVNLIGTLHDNQTDEDAGAWDVTINDDGAGGGRIRVTGDAVLGVTWYVSGRVQHVILTP